MRHALFLLVLSQANLFAQDKWNTAASSLPLITVKTNIATLINPAKQAFAFTTDLRIAPRFSIDAGGGAFFNSTTFARYKGESYKGMRLRAGFKYFVYASERIAFHAGMEAKYNGIKHLSYRQALRQGGQYIETMLANRKVKTMGLASRIGWYVYAGSKKQFLLEPYMGLGVMWHDVSLDLPPDAELFRENELFSFEYRTGKSRSLDVLLGLHFGYAFW